MNRGATRWRLIGCSLLTSLAAAATSCKRGDADSWQPNVEYVYDVALESVAGDAQTPIPLFDIAIKGKLHVLSHPLREHTQPLTLWIEDAKVTSVSAADQQGQIAALTAELAQPSEVQLEQGLVTGFDITTPRGVVSVSVMRTLASALQLGPAPEGKATFETHEYDSTGRYVARNERKQADRAHKQKLRYELVVSRMQSSAGLPVQGKPVVPSVESSAVDVRLEHGVPASVVLSERISAPLLTSSKLNASTELKLSLVAKAQRSAAPASTGARLHLAASDPYLAQPKIGDLDGTRIGDRTFESVLADLEAYAAESDPSKLARFAAAASDADKARDSERSLQRNRAFSALNALIRQQPEVVNAAVAKIRSGSPAARVLVSGLASSGSAEAQQSLVMLLTTRHWICTCASRSACRCCKRINPPSRPRARSRRCSRTRAGASSRAMGSVRSRADCATWAKSKRASDWCKSSPGYSRAPKTSKR